VGDVGWIVGLMVVFEVVGGEVGASAWWLVEVGHRGQLKLV
jgi:hypothetical protein